MLHPENIGVSNLSIKNEEGLATGNVVAKIRARDYGFGDLRSVSGYGNRCMTWIVRENRTGMKSFVRMRYAEGGVSRLDRVSPEARPPWQPQSSLVL